MKQDTTLLKQLNDMSDKALLDFASLYEGMEGSELIDVLAKRLRELRELYNCK